MPFDLHTVEVADAPSGATCTPVAYLDRVVLGLQANVANAAGESAGVAVTTSLIFPSGLPANYGVQVTTNQNCFAVVTNKTVTGFDVVLTPTTSGVTLAAGTFDVAVIG